jgi:hypothetical protein
VPNRLPPVGHILSTDANSSRIEISICQKKTSYQSEPREHLLRRFNPSSVIGKIMDPVESAVTPALNDVTPARGIAIESRVLQLPPIVVSAEKVRRDFA